MPKKQSIEILNDMVAMIGKHLKKGMRIRIPGLGIMQVRHRPARMGRNPATGEAIKIKASKKVAFRVVEGPEGERLRLDGAGRLAAAPTIEMNFGWTCKRRGESSGVCAFLLRRGETCAIVMR